MESLIKTKKAKKNFADKHARNILTLLDILPVFPLTTVEMKRYN